MRILQVEPSQLFQKIVREILLDYSQGLLQLSQPRQALETALSSGPWALIVLSRELGRTGSGADLCEGFIANYRSQAQDPAPVLVLTSTEDPEMARKLCELGAADVILKRDLGAKSFDSFLNAPRRHDSIKELFQRIRVAVLDDSTMELNIIKNIFDSHGLGRIDYYSRPRDLLDSTNEYDIFLVDVMLPEVSGEEVVRRLRKKHPGSVILLMSAMSTYSAIAKVLDAGAQDYIPKPFIPDVLLLRLRSAVRDHLLIDTLLSKGIQLPGNLP